MSRFINLSLLAEPVNWLSVALIVAIGGYSIALLTNGLNTQKGSK